MDPSSMTQTGLADFNTKYTQIKQNLARIGGGSQLSQVASQASIFPQASSENQTAPFQQSGMAQVMGMMMQMMSMMMTLVSQQAPGKKLSSSAELLPQAPQTDLKSLKNKREDLSDQYNTLRRDINQYDMDSPEFEALADQLAGLADEDNELAEEALKLDPNFDKKKDKESNLTMRFKRDILNKQKQSIANSLGEIKTAAAAFEPESPQAQNIQATIARLQHHYEKLEHDMECL
jgi:hypothetical protein